MRCPVCQDDFSSRHSACPKCQILLLPVQGETISEHEQLESEQSRSGLMTILRVAGLVIALIGLATVVRLNYVSGGREREAKSKAGPSASISPVVSDSADKTARTKVVAGSPEEVLSRQTDGKKEELSEEKNNSLSAHTRRGPESLRSVTQDNSDKKSSAAKPENNTANNASLNNIAESAAASATSSVAAAPQAEPSVTASAPEAESGTEINLEPLDKTLGVNTGLVTLDSYTKARIYVDGQFSGITPRTIKLLSGEHTILLIADGYEEWTRKIRLNGRQQTGLMASMNRKAIE